MKLLVLTQFVFSSIPIFEKIDLSIVLQAFSSNMLCHYNTYAHMGAGRGGTLIVNGIT
jgi:hypothetical protein